MKVQLVFELELNGDGDLSDEAIDAWAWAAERQLEEMDLVKTASVVDFTVKEPKGVGR